VILAPAWDHWDGRAEDDHNSDISPTPTALGGHLSPREAVDDGESKLHGRADGVCPVPDGAGRPASEGDGRQTGRAGSGTSPGEGLR